MKRRDGYLYHAIVKPSPHTAKKYLDCPNQGRRLPPSVGRKCPICGLPLRGRARNPSWAKGKDSSRHWSQVVGLTYKPWCRKDSRHSETRRFLVENVPAIRERLAPIMTVEAFKMAERAARARRSG